MKWKLCSGCLLVLFFLALSLLPLSAKGLTSSITKITILDFVTNGCHWCVKLDEVWQEVIKNDELMNSFILNKINDEKIAKQYYIRGYPTIVFLKDNKEIKRLVGYQSKEELLNALQELSKRAS